MRQILRTYALPWLAVTMAACSSPFRAAPAPAPAPETTAAAPADVTAAPRPAAPPASKPAPGRLPPPPPIADDAEMAALLKQAADDAADSVLLARIASEAAGTAPTRGQGPEPALENPLRTSGVTWDINVEPYEDHDRVRYWVNFFSTTARTRFGIWLARMQRYEPMIRSRLQQQGLPGDLIYLALIESGFSNTAVSRARAVGMWQFMRPTALGVGLRVDRWVDERRDPVRATDAAARHLDVLRRQFGSLYLAAAAYNAGGGKVSRSLRKLGPAERPALGGGAAPDDPDAEAAALEEEDEEGWSDDDFFRLHDTRLLHQETRDYVPKLIAAAMIAKEPARYGFTEVVPEPLFEADSLVVDDMTGLDVIARLAGTSVATIRELNPQYLRWATPPGRTSIVRVPAGTGPQARLAYADLPVSERVTFATHVARKGETLTRVARRYGVSLAALKEANPGMARLRAGTRVLVPRGGSVSLAAAASVATAEAAEYHKVRRGETATRIARRYGISVAELKAWNRGKVAKNGRLKAGVRLLVSEPEARPTLAKAKASRKATTASRAAARDAEVAEAPTRTAKARTTATKGGATNVAAKATPKKGAKARARSGSHTVRRGDTLTGLARRYGVSVDAIRKANRLRDGDIRAGQKLRIPA